MSLCLHFVEIYKNVGNVGEREDRLYRKTRTNLLFTELFTVCSVTAVPIQNCVVLHDAIVLQDTENVCSTTIVYISTDSVAKLSCLQSSLVVNLAHK